MSIAMYSETLASWLCMPIKTSRMYLEANRELLSPACEHLIEVFISQNGDDQKEQQRLFKRKQLLWDARERGGTMQAVREAYINLCGGLVLDLPPWLGEIEHQLTPLAHTDWTERMVAVSKMRLRDAISDAYLEYEDVPEIRAELEYRLGNLFAMKSSHDSLTTLKIAVAYYEAALQVYTRERYPRQYAKVLNALEGLQ